MIAVKIGFLFLIALGLGLAIRFLGRWNGGSPGRRPESRSRLVRILCGAGGGAILVAFAVVTFRTAGREAVDVAGPRNLRVPTLPAPADAPGTGAKPVSGRFLLHLVVVRPRQVEGPAVASETFDLHWPRDRTRSFALQATVGTATVYSNVMFEDLHWGSR